jgi:hypothetical protein
MDIDADAVEFLSRAGAGAIQHHGGSLLEHLVGTNRLLTAWGCPPSVCTAGLFHSFYTWLAEPTEKSRRALAAAIGRDAEELVYLFGSTSPDDLVKPEAMAEVATGTYANLLRLDLANTRDILGRAFLTSEQRQRLLSRCAAAGELLALLDTLHASNVEKARA